MNQRDTITAQAAIIEDLRKKVLVLEEELAGVYVALTRASRPLSDDDRRERYARLVGSEAP